MLPYIPNMEHMGICYYIIYVCVYTHMIDTLFRHAYRCTWHDFCTHAAVLRCSLVDLLGHPLICWPGLANGPIPFLRHVIGTWGPGLLNQQSVKFIMCNTQIEYAETITMQIEYYILYIYATYYTCFFPNVPLVSISDKLTAVSS